MNSTPDAVLRHALDYVPSKAFLPIANVSKRFRFVWLADDASALSSEMNNEEEVPRHVDERKIPARTGEDDEEDDDERKMSAIPEMPAAELRAVWSSGDAAKKNQQAETNRTAPTLPRNRRLTNPLQIGNLFSVPWNKPARKALNTALLAYYIEQGWEGKMRSVLTGAAARGDIEGMKYIFDKKMYPEDDVEICTIAAAAGQLEALIWLREVKEVPWDPTEIHRESSENLHEDVMEYVEKNSEGHKIQLSYGVGLPW